MAGLRQEPALKPFSDGTFVCTVRPGEKKYPGACGRRPPEWGGAGRPRPGGGLTSAKASLKSMFGPIASSWTVNNGQFTLDVTVPPNTTAIVHLPDETKHEVGSGTYQYVVKA